MSAPLAIFLGYKGTTVSEAFRRKTYNLLAPHVTEHWSERVFNVAIVVLILVSVTGVVLETVPELQDSYALVFYGISVVSATVFGIEYILRLWVCTLDPKYAGPWGRLRYALSPGALIDLAAVVPFYVATLGVVDLRYLMALRLLRIFLFFKLVRYSRAMQLLLNVIARQREVLLVTLTIGAVLLVLASTLIYFVEHEAQPQQFPHIPGAMWWGMITLTTVGYGDVYPVTPLGRALGGLIAVMGIGLFALPAGIVASGFAEEIQSQKTQKPCPHCGKLPDEPHVLDHAA